MSAGALLDDERWQAITWRRGAKGPLKAVFAARRVRVADGPAVPLHDRNDQHMPGEEVRLVGERRASGERKYCLSNPPADADLKTSAATIKARWVCEQARQQLKEELGLDRFEGRSWTGLHRHALMAMAALAFLRRQRPAAAGRGKKERTAIPAELAGGEAGHRGSSRPLASTARALPALPAVDHAAPAYA